MSVAGVLWGCAQSWDRAVRRALDESAAASGAAALAIASDSFCRPAVVACKTNHTPAAECGVLLKCQAIQSAVLRGLVEWAIAGADLAKAIDLYRSTGGEKPAK